MDFASKFPTRSLRNQLLIFLQKPNANLVAGLKTWNKFGRQVVKGSQAIKIFAPITKKEKEIDEKTKAEVEKTVVKGFKTANVFDVNDTKGVPLPLNPIVPKNVNESEFANKVYPYLVEKLQKELPIEVDPNYDSRGNGYYSPLEHKIVINAADSRDITNQFRTLIHEYTHSVFHCETGKYKGYDKETKEVQAESVAYLTLKSFGMDTSDYSFAYIKGWAADKDEKILLAYQDDIQKESAAIISKIEDVVLDKNLSFNAPVILDSNTTSIQAGEKNLSLVQFGESYTIITGDYKESDLNNLESIKKLGLSFDKKEIAETTFNLMKGHVPLEGLKQIDQEKGKIHMYQRTVLDPKDLVEKKMYFVGVPSFTNVKTLTDLTLDKEKALSTFKQITQNKDIGVSQNKKIEKDLAMRDRDGDGLTDLQEKRLGTNPLSRDTDQDGIPDNIDKHPGISSNSKGLELSL